VAGVDPETLGAVRRADGRVQLTYRGSPLYIYVGDRVAGDARGDDFEQFGGRWQAVAIPSPE
jgi:predicted lipoprotein with Yx(FWY)xxD motif